MFLKKKKKKPSISSFKCPSSAAAKHLWKCAVEQQYFYKSVAEQLFCHFGLLFSMLVCHAAVGQFFQTSDDLWKVLNWKFLQARSGRCCL